MESVDVGHEPLPPTVGRNVLGRKVLYLPGFFTYGERTFLPASARWSPRGTEIPRKGKERRDRGRDLLTGFLLQVGHEPLPPTVGRNVLGRKVLYLPGFFTYARHIVEVDGKRGLFRGLTPRLISSTLSTITRGSVKKVLMEREISREADGVFSAIGRIFKEEGILGFFVGLVPHILGDVIFLWCCNLLAHFINTYAVDDNFSQASVIRSYTKFVMGIAVSMLTYPFLLVGDLMAVNNCGLRAGLPPYAPAFTSWIHCWRYLSAQGQLFRGSSLLFRRAPMPAACFPID
ncbi:PREDICTED: mitochondrial carrier homolog 1 [Aptenodytes forsteri]|uniref:mitochondrial carrier homolog 1 n=1 Tax=Aptenodytes forsteri TaxID=9233 RepID=UPI0009048967|nr:PREDICTED: mitochondrial carrier homolog 1 [Aptenodytes forsteri]